MKIKDLITVYITNYNYGKYIDKCIQSILKQTYKNIELIIIDDGSSDNSKENLKKYEKIKKIKIIYQKNKGLNITNNIAIKVSTGRYIIRVDADDWLREDAISSLYKEIKKDKKIAMVFSNYYEVNVVQRYYVVSGGILIVGITPCIFWMFIEFTRLYTTVDCLHYKKKALE